MKISNKARASLDSREWAVLGGSTHDQDRELGAIRREYTVVDDGRFDLTTGIPAYTRLRGEFVANTSTVVTITSDISLSEIVDKFRSGEFEIHAR